MKQRHISGPTGIDDRYLVIECAGRIDLDGLLKSVTVSNFLLHRFKFQEKILHVLNETEKKAGRQSGMIYVLDLDGLAYDPSILPIATGIRICLFYLHLS